jgi:hypothetical protein
MNSNAAMNLPSLKSSPHPRRISPSPSLHSYVALRSVWLILFLAVAAAMPAVADDEEGFVPMFNGTDLTGWEGQRGAWWVEDGAITAQSTPDKPCLAAHYLYWTKDEPADFVMRFQYKLAGGNSGVQFRSEPRPQYDTWGYQADMEAGPEWTGCLFQHDRGGVVMRGYKAVIAEDGTRTEEQFADPAELQKVVKSNDWNDYEITAIGTKIVLRINGELMCEVDDRDKEMGRAKGLIALQMHPGPPMKVQFREMRIKILPEPAGG